MTKRQLSELLGELAEPVSPRGVSERAWQQAQLIRRRRRATLGAATAVTLAAGALTVVRTLPSGPGDLTDPASTAGRSVDPRRSSPGEADSPAPARQLPPAARISGAPAWLSPQPEAERRLPLLRSVLPDRIDLTRTAPLLRDQPLPRAMAAYQLTTEAGDLGPVLVLGVDGELRRVDLPDLEWVPDGQGNASTPFTRTSLSPDGRRIAFAQEHEIVLLTLADASWQRFPVRGVSTDLFQWFSSDSVFSGSGPVVDVRTGSLSEVDFEPYPLRSEGYPIGSWWGPARTHGSLVAQAGFSTTITKPAAGDGNPEVIAVGGSRRALLVMHSGDVTGTHARYKGCCEVISWLDGDTVAFESGTKDRHVLAWNTRTGQVNRITQVIPPPAAASIVASYADLTRL